ncbi:hypothetical protein PHSC3_000661 [Chlamydiales bacterium STE3]|nr:hypothetical protein PHSC3_000661 [Chlamydiales bacterium STE3]
MDSLAVVTKKQNSYQPPSEFQTAIRPLSQTNFKIKRIAEILKNIVHVCLKPFKEIFAGLKIFLLSNKDCYASNNQLEYDGSAQGVAPNEKEIAKQKQEMAEGQEAAQAKKNLERELIFTTLDEQSRRIERTNIVEAPIGLLNFTGNNCYMNASLQQLQIYLAGQESFDQLLRNSLSREMDESLEAFEKRVLHQWAPLTKEAKEDQQRYEDRILFKWSFLVLAQSLAWKQEEQILESLKAHHKACFQLNLGGIFEPDNDKEQQDAAEYLDLWHQILEWQPMQLWSQKRYEDGNGEFGYRPVHIQSLNFIRVSIPQFSPEIQKIIKNLEKLGENELVPIRKEHIPKIDKLKKRQSKLEEKIKIGNLLLEELKAIARKEEIGADQKVLNMGIKTELEGTSKKISEMEKALNPSESQIVSRSFSQTNSKIQRIAKILKSIVHVCLKPFKEFFACLRIFLLTNKDCYASEKEFKAIARKEKIKSHQKVLDGIKTGLERTSKEISGMKRSLDLMCNKIIDKTRSKVDEIAAKHQFGAKHQFDAKELFSLAFTDEEIEMSIEEINRSAIDTTKLAKKASDGELPGSFMIQFKRFYGGFQKVKNKIRFEQLMEIDLKSYFNEEEASTINDGEALYKLSGFIVHKGGYGSGHYISYVKKGDVWHKCDDEDVTQINERELPITQAYICSYLKA